MNPGPYQHIPHASTTHYTHGSGRHPALAHTWHPALSRTWVRLTAVAVIAISALLLASRAFSQESPRRDAESLRISIFTPTTEGNTSWPEVHRIMRQAAAELNLELAFHEFDVGDRFAKADEGVEILQVSPVSDAAIFSVAYGQAEALMDAAEELGIPFFLHGPLFPEEVAQLGGGPRQSYEHWIGYFHEDEELKGYLLARELITAARLALRSNNRSLSTDTIRLVGVGGDTTWYGNVLREAGLRRAVAESRDARLLQVVPTRWTQEEGRQIASRLLYRYTDVAAIWAASDQLALGAAEALEVADLHPGVDAFTGGLDFSRIGLEAVTAGRLSATVAAPISMWADVLRYLSEYLHGNDFADETGARIIFEPQVATPDTVGADIPAGDQ